MRARMRTALIAVGVALGALLALLIATAVTGSQTLALVTGAVGVLGLVGALVMIRQIAHHAIATTNRTGTRLSNLEKRVAAEASQATATAEALAETEAALESLRADTAQSQRVDAVQADLAAVERTVRILRRRVPEGYLDPIRSELADQDSRTRAELARVDSSAQNAWMLSVESAVQLGRRPRSFLTADQALDLFERYLEQDRLLEAGPLITHYRLLERLDLGTLRMLYRHYRATGYWDLARLTLKQVAGKSGRAGDRTALAKLERDIAVFSRPTRVNAELPPAHAHDPSGPILHMVGKVLPETQTGYTLRTHYTARAQSRRGLPVVVVGQAGITAERVEKTTHYRHDEVDYYLLAGSARGDALVDEWLRANIAELADLVRRLRPSVLHAHSDFHNALIAHAVGAAYGIPTVYESRGFWEESWITRAISMQGWGKNAENIFATYGHPSAYTLRKHAEDVARTLVDHNITLAQVMKDHILTSSEQPVPAEQVTIVPNAVDPEEFEIQDRDPALAARLGVPEDAVVIGYISSMVEYESIETLIDGFSEAAARASTPVHLLLVGGGSHLEALREHARRAGVENIIFTGSVPHEEVLRYYGLIDIFVVPRRKSPVADLVTPLKPFEAFATGRAVVLSDVDALQEIAEESGVAETFRAGYHRDLGRKLAALADDPQRRRDLGVRGARWVRSRRTWDRNVAEYYRVYRDLGFRGAADASLDEELQRRRQLNAPVPQIDRGSGRRRRSSPSSASSEDGQRGASPELERSPTPAVVASGAPDPVPDLPGRGRRAVVVAMKPQIAGRIRRNILTLLELGFEVTVVNSTPRADFFQGLEHPRLSADFVEVRSLAVRYQARMTRKKNERQAKWDREKKERAQRARVPAQDAPEWMRSDAIPGTELLYRGWTSESGREMRQRLDQAWKDADKRTSKFLRTTRQKRDLRIRDQLKQVHLVNRFVEFWRLSPDRIAAHRPDLVVSSDLPGLVGASIAARRLGVPHLHDCHELYLESTTLRPSERKVLWPVEKAYMKRADSVVIVNETIRDEYAERYGVHGTVLRNAAPAVSDEIRSNPVNLRVLAGVSQDAKIVLYQGGLVAGRGLDVCVRAAAHFPDGVHLVFIGKGKSLDELTSLAEDLGVTDRVHFLPAVEPGELPAYTAAADVGVIPYQPVSRNNEYALPNKVFEYTGAGIPFVASDLPELRRIAESAHCGEVYDPFDPTQLAAAVDAVLDPQRHPSYRQNAETFGRENTWETEREILVAEISRLTADAPAR